MFMCSEERATQQQLNWAWWTTTPENGRPSLLPFPCPIIWVSPRATRTSGTTPSRVEKAFQQVLRTGSQDDGRAGQPSTSRRNTV